MKKLKIFKTLQDASVPRTIFNYYTFLKWITLSSLTCHFLGIIPFIFLHQNIGCIKDKYGTLNIIFTDLERGTRLLSKMEMCQRGPIVPRDFRLVAVVYNNEMTKYCGVTS